MCKISNASINFKPMNTNEINEIQKLRRQLWALASAIVISLFLFGYCHFDACYKEREHLQSIINKKSDTLSDTNHDLQVIEDSVDLLNLEIYTNKVTGDKLQNRMMNSLDSLENLEKKLHVYQNNSLITKEVLVSLLDSVDFYRRQSKYLKQEIDSITQITAKLIKKIRFDNSKLQEKIDSYEKRMMALYAINMVLVAYKDGYNNNEMLITSDKAKKVEEITARFRLSRSLTSLDVVRTDLMRDNQRIATMLNVRKDKKRNIRGSFKIPQAQKLVPGTYQVVVFHTNLKFGVNRVEIGRGTIELK